MLDCCAPLLDGQGLTMKSSEGCRAAAISNTSLRFFSLSPLLQAASWARQVSSAAAASGLRARCCVLRAQRADRSQQRCLAAAHHLDRMAPGLRTSSDRLASAAVFSTSIVWMLGCTEHQFTQSSAPPSGCARC